mgnify:FL=1
MRLRGQIFLPAEYQESTTDGVHAVGHLHSQGSALSSSYCSLHGKDFIGWLTDFLVVEGNCQQIYIGNQMVLIPYRGGVFADCVVSLLLYLPLARLAERCAIKKPPGRVAFSVGDGCGGNLPAIRLQAHIAQPAQRMRYATLASPRVPQVQFRKRRYK